MAASTVSTGPPYSLFFYGTLCHAAVLSRVIDNDGAHLTTTDAALLEHVRLHVEGEDYPAVVTRAEAEQALGRPVTDEEARVQGVVVSGLTEADVAALDEFEGNEYTRTPYTVQPFPLASPTTLIPASFYHWTAPISRLAPRIWSFEAFLRDSAHRWVGSGSEKEYAEVDRRRAMGGFITPRGVKEIADKVTEEMESGARETERKAKEKERKEIEGEGEELGKKLREKYWRFEEGWVNLNHGSYGAAPAPVIDRFRAIQDRCDSAPDRFIRLEYEPELIALRSRLARFVDCDTDDLVLVGNATTGVNVVLRSLTGQWEKGDRLLYFSTTIYDACSSTLQYIVDTHPHLSLSLLPVPLTYPISHADLMAKTRAAIEDAEKDGGGKVRLALVDAISSNPGVVVPWEQLVQLFREKGVLSLIDAAHQIGQLPVSLRKSNPDFWISNCHKWLLAHRGCAVLYVNKAHQHLIHSIPIGHYYDGKRTPARRSDWVTEFSWNGTLDWSPLLSVSAALDFREDVLGGEERIYEWCHGLAVQGGEKVARMLGTRIMRNGPDEGELVGCMVNVLLPLPSCTPVSKLSPSTISRIKDFWFNELSEKHRTIVPLFVHNDHPYVRLSAQVYTDLADFEYVGGALRKVCEQIERGEHLQRRVETRETTRADEP
ncbi:hypothetical protein JCM21900_006910 [Sporobolomyces salmonicolor]